MPVGVLFSFILVPISLRILWQPYDECRKLIDTIENHDVLRFVEGYPLVPDLHLKAKSVQQANQALGAVASIRVDIFRSNFKSEDNWKSVFYQMDDALMRRKREAGEIDN
jgi:hypothetical protein